MTHLNKLLISQNKAIQLLDTNHYLFKNFILCHLEIFVIGKRKKIVLQSLINFIQNKKESPLNSPNLIYPNKIADSLCQKNNNSRSPKKVRIVL